MARMTEEEAWALDDEVTRNPPDVAGEPGGFFTDRRDRIGEMAREQYENGYGDYTKEKYQQPDVTVEEIDVILKK